MCHFRDAQRSREIYQLDSASESIKGAREDSINENNSASNRYLHEDDRLLDFRATPIVRHQNLSWKWNKLDIQKISGVDVMVKHPAANLTYRAEGCSKIHAWKPWLQLQEH